VKVVFCTLDYFDSNFDDAHALQSGEDCRWKKCQISQIRLEKIFEILFHQMGAFRAERKWNNDKKCHYHIIWHID
jgi:hypothetical protein